MRYLYSFESVSPVSVTGISIGGAKDGWNGNQHYHTFSIVIVEVATKLHNLLLIQKPSNILLNTVQMHPDAMNFSLTIIQS
jgi:hypothetical protein